MAFPLTHVYVTARVIGSPNSTLLLGSILPDLVLFFSDSIQDWYQFHEKGADILSTCMKYKKLIDGQDLLTGMYLHSVSSKGLDWYSDATDVNRPYSEYDGFMFRHCYPLAHRVRNNLGMDEEKSIVLAHNFIETAVSLRTAECFPESLRMLSEALSFGQEPAWVDLITEAFDIPSLEVYRAWRLMSDIFSVDDQRSMEGYVRLWTKLSCLTLGCTLEISLIEDLLLQAQSIIDGNWLSFLNDSIRGLSMDFKPKLEMTVYDNQEQQIGT